MFFADAAIIGGACAPRRTCGNYLSHLSATLHSLKRQVRLNDFDFDFNKLPLCMKLACLIYRAYLCNYIYYVYLITQIWILYMNISAIVGTQHINWNRNRNHLLCTPNCYRFCYLTTPFRSGKKLRNMLKIYKILKIFATHWASIARKGWRVCRYTVYSIQLICSLYELWDVTKCSSSKGVSWNATP